MSTSSAPITTGTAPGRRTLADVAARPPVRPAGAAGASDLVAVDESLAELLPWGGLRRGETVVVAGSTSLALALAARPSRDGAWCAAVGLPSLGVSAAYEIGVDLARLVLVPRPGERWAEVVAALVDAVDLVVVRLPSRVPDAVARRLQARVLQRGAVLLALPATSRPSTVVHRSAGSDRTDLQGAATRLTVVGQRWEGIGHGHGHLTHRRLTVRVDGRGRAARPRTLDLDLPTSTTPPTPPTSLPVPPGRSTPPTSLSTPPSPVRLPSPAGVSVLNVEAG